MIHTPSTGDRPHACNQYDVCLVLVHPERQVEFGEMPVIDSSLQIQGIQALIGRDVLSHCLFVYDGKDDRFIFAF